MLGKASVFWLGLYWLIVGNFSYDVPINMLHIGVGSSTP